MSLLSGAKAMLGIVDVEEKDGNITVSGMYAYQLTEDIQRIWNTSKIAKFMFTHASRTAIRMPSFFAIEFVYILNKLINESKTRSSRGALERTRDVFIENTWLSSTNKPVQPWLNYKATDAFIYKLLPHQVDFLNRYETNKKQYGLKGYLLYAPAGSGKSATDIATALAVEATKVIIVCPKNAVYRVWEKTLTQELKAPEHPYIADRDLEKLQPKKKYHVFHYERLDFALDLIGKWNVHNEKICIILDESHNFNVTNSLRTERFIELCDKSKSNDIIWASGTPIKALGSESIPLLRSIDPLFTPKVEEAFKKMYGRDATRTLDILQHRLGLVSFTVPKSNVMSDKPIEEQVLVKIPNSKEYLLSNLKVKMREFVDKQTAHYANIRSDVKKEFYGILDTHRAKLHRDKIPAFEEYLDAVKWLDRHPGYNGQTHNPYAIITNAYEKSEIIPTLDKQTRDKFIHYKSIVKYTDLKVRGECLGVVLTKARIQCHLDMLEHINFNELIQSVEKKTLIFTSYVKVLEAANKHLSSLGYKPIVVYGDTTNELPAIVSKFDKDATINPLIATFQSLSTAVPLTMANGVIFLNSPWRSFERDQTIARAHRLGQDKPVYVYDIILDTGKELNISSRSLDIMKWSREQVELITGIKDDDVVSTESLEMTESVTNTIVEDIASETEEQVLERTFGEGVDETPVEMVTTANALSETEEPGIRYINLALHENTQDAYNAVSIELRNPFAAVTSNVTEMMTNLYNSVANQFKRAFSLISKEKMNQFNESAVYSKTMQKVGKEEIRFIDLANIVVFHPMQLKKTTSMVEYAAYINEALDICLDFVEHSGDELERNLDIYLSTPTRGADPTVAIITDKAAKVSFAHLDDMKNKYASIADSNGTQTQRPLNKLYANYNEYVLTEKHIKEIIDKRKRILNAVGKLEERAKRVYDKSNKLIGLVKSNPNEYKLSSGVASRLAHMSNVFATEIEFVGSSVYLSTSTIQSFTDTVKRLK